MPRASWRGFLRLSLVSCPIYLSPATTRTKSIRLHQVWQATPADEADEVSDRARAQDVKNRQPGSPSITVATRQVTLARQLGLPSPRDPNTGEEVEKEEVVKGYEYQRGQF